MATIILLETKLKEYEEWRLTQWQIRNTDHTLQYGFWQRICPSQNVSKREPFWLKSNFLVQAAHDINKAISFTGCFSSTVACCDLLQPSPHALLPFLDDHIRIGDKLQIRDNAALGNTLINCQFSVITGDTPTKRGSGPHLFFTFTHLQWTTWQMAHNFTWWIYIFIHKIHNYVIQKSD